MTQIEYETIEVEEFGPAGIGVNSVDGMKRIHKAIDEGNAFIIKDVEGNIQLCMPDIIREQLKSSEYTISGYVDDFWALKELWKIGVYARLNSKSSKKR